MLLRVKVSASMFPSRDGTLLHGQLYGPSQPRGIALIIHGFGDHGGRYLEVAQTLTGLGFAALAVDYRGHGKAAGKRGHCERFSEFVDDLDAALVQAREIVREGPLILVTHSHGGLIALRSLFEPGHAPQLDGLVLSSPFLGLPKPVPMLKGLLARITSSMLPSLTLPSDLRVEDLTHDEDIRRQSQADPLRHAVGTVRWFTEMERAQAYVLEHMNQLTVPSLWLLSEPDPIVSAQVARRAFERAGGDKKLVAFPGFFHEIFNETERAKVLSELSSWILSKF
jgi:lysophospholipase